MMMYRFLLVWLQNDFEDTEPVVLKQNLMVARSGYNRIKLRIPLCWIAMCDNVGCHAYATFVFQRKEVDTFASVHPTQWAWYVPGGMDGVPEERLALVDGDVELGIGVALLATPGHTDGNQSLCLNTPDGIWVTSENGIAADSWHPHLSHIPGIRRWADAFGREVVMNANTLEDSVDQYDSMIKEKSVADANRDDPRWANVFPSSELVRQWRAWPVVPTFEYGGINYGVLRRLVRLQLGEDRLGLQVGAQALGAVLAADAGGLEAAERRGRVDRAPGVDVDRAGAQQRGEPVGVGDVARPDAGGEAVLAGVGALGHLLERLVGLGHEHRAEDLLADDRGVVVGRR